MTYLDFEKPVEELTIEIEKLNDMGVKNNVDVTLAVANLEEKLILKKKEIYGNLTAWQRVQLSRHPERPYTLSYMNAVTDNTWIELFGDRNVRDCKAMIGGFGRVDGKTVMFIGQQKGINTKMRQLRQFGMANPEGYRKALRLMKLAEKFNKPIVTFIDTQISKYNKDFIEKSRIFSSLVQLSKKSLNKFVSNKAFSIINILDKKIMNIV
jgi:acetyl-CoA carboxylase carboxyl transferase subunit alpha